MIRNMSRTEKLDVLSATCLIGFAGDSSRADLDRESAVGGGETEPTGRRYRADIVLVCVLLVFVSPSGLVN